jgi:6,7-dimethyl-8-ribityllumazine synthase
MVASKTKSSLPKNAAEGKHIALIVSRYHEDIAQELLSGAQDTLKGLGAKSDDISVFWVPGAFEIPSAARAVSQHREVDAIVCLGLILKGETPHNEYLAHEVARGISQIHAATGIPTTFGVLTADTAEQAKARSGGNKGNKGSEAAEAAVSMIVLLDEIKEGPKKQTKSVGF